MHNILSVTEVNKYIKGILSNDLILSGLWVRGEISNYKHHYTGHRYFTIKDENSILKCVMFKSHAASLKFNPENGMKVVVNGYISVFERDGQYQLYVQQMQPDGIGALHIAFEQLKMRLYQEGLFDREHKKPLPYLPGSIGVVTSSTGAVIRDIINILSRRFHNFNLKLFPVAVQGESAALQISRAIRKFNELGCVDVIIIARGGGSLEELWAFNEEVVARSIFESRIPVISAVGHETDFTIADFVADMRAPTPSAAAEIVMPEKAAVINTINNLNTRLVNAVLKKLSLSRAKLDAVRNSAVFRQPYNRVYQERMRLDLLDKYMRKALETNYEKQKARFSMLAGKLDALSPLTILSRGYSIAKSCKDGKIIKSIKGIEKGDPVEINVSDGKIKCTVDGVEGGAYGTGKLEL